MDGSSGARPPSIADRSYRVYRSRPWAGVGEIASGGRRRRLALGALVLVLCGCVLAGLGIAGAFSGPGSALEAAARAHRHRLAGHPAAGVRRHRRSVLRALSQHRSAARSSLPASAGAAASSTATSSPAATASSPSNSPQTGTTPASSASATSTDGGGTAGGGGLASAIALDAQGHYLLESGNYPAAIAMLRRAMAATGVSTGACLQPGTQACLTYAYALYDLATALQREGDPAAAVPLLRQRLQIDNQRAVVRAELQLARAQSRR